MSEENQVEAVETETTEATEGKTRIAIPTENYVSAKSASGSKSKHNGDVVATALAGQDIDAVYGIAGEMLDTDVDALREKYAHLNVGQQRMNLGNRIRGAVNRMTKKAETEEGKKEGLLTGEAFLEGIMDGYPLPEPEAKAEETEAEAE
jgi:hypothetical protein